VAFRYSIFVFKASKLETLSSNNLVSGPYARVSESSVILAATITSLLLLGGVSFSAALVNPIVNSVRDGDPRCKDSMIDL
jgi:hypothetical protein